LNTIRYRVLEITATVEPFENNRGHTLRVLRAGKPRSKKPPITPSHTPEHTESDKSVAAAPQLGDSDSIAKPPPLP
ncbi:MAG TPA: hypothetical protein VEC99_16450, partial [Clostridia bacterium]|nr:hypothetical protein [Clostridia bacterium]